MLLFLLPCTFDDVTKEAKHPHKLDPIHLAFCFEPPDDE